MYYAVKKQRQTFENTRELMLKPGAEGENGRSWKKIIKGVLTDACRDDVWLFKQTPFGGLGFLCFFLLIIKIIIHSDRFEIQEVRNKLLSGETESTIMPQSNTQRIMGWMDEIRRQIGVVYKED
jgi:hypothetical protein